MYSEKLQILEEILGKFYRTNDECLFFCPYCEHHKRKLSINITKNTYKCWICDSRGRNIYNLIRKFGNHSQKQHWRSFDKKVELSDFDSIFEETKEEEEEEVQRISLPKEYTCLANRQTPRAMKYIKSRGITQEDILKWKIGFCDEGEYRNRIIIPSFNNDGYSGNLYDVDQATKNRIIYPSLDPSIFEIKYPNKDIRGRAVTL